MYTMQFPIKKVLNINFRLGKPSLIMITMELQNEFYNVHCNGYCRLVVYHVKDHYFI